MSKCLALVLDGNNQSCFLRCCSLQSQVKVLLAIGQKKRGPSYLVKGPATSVQFLPKPKSHWRIVMDACREICVTTKVSKA